MAIFREVDTQEGRLGIPHRKNAHGRNSDVQADYHVPKEDPRRDEAVLVRSGLLRHDVRVRRVEAQSCRRWAIRHKVYPQELNGNQPFRKAKGSSDEDRGHLAHVAAYHVPNESFHVVVNSPSLPHSTDNGGEVVIGEHHVTRLLGNLCSSNTHCDTNVRQGESRCVVHPISCHGNDIASICLQKANNILLVLWLCATEEQPARLGIGTLLEDAQPLRRGHPRREKVGARERPVIEVIPLLENSNVLANAFRRQLVVSGDHNHSDAGILAARDGFLDLRPWRVLKPGQANKAKLALELTVTADVFQELVSGMARASVVARKFSKRPWIVFHCYREAPQSLHGHVLDHFADFASHALRQQNFASICVHEVCAALEHRFRGPLHHQLILVLPRFGLLVRDKHAHALPVPVELQDGPPVVALQNGFAVGENLARARPGAGGKRSNLLREDLHSRLRWRAHCLVGGGIGLLFHFLHACFVAKRAHSHEAFP
mmetsp:Transcript_613/g.1781  ORF Transcript_613/g.1781 Transcript_613/m.1781 type:complete len:487 (+) Transcript_613:2694-4154(+)